MAPTQPQFSFAPQNGTPQVSVHNGNAQVTLPINVAATPSASAVSTIQNVTPPDQAHAGATNSNDPEYDDDDFDDDSLDDADDGDDDDDGDDGDDGDDDDDDDDEGQDDNQDQSSRRPINLLVRTPVIINGSGNMYTLDPSDFAVRVAMHVLKGLQTASHSVPMIDDNGKVRPVTIQADATVTITGSCNVIGSHMDIVAHQQALQATARMTSTASQRTSAQPNGSPIVRTMGDMSLTNSKDGRKRERENSEDAEYSKRSRFT